MRQRTNYIKLTRQAVKDMFDECNRLYFSGKVETPLRFETWTPYRKTLGMVRPVWDNKSRTYKAVLHISRRYRWTSETLRHVVVHEMIHLSIGDYRELLTPLQRLPLIGRFFITEHDSRFIDTMNEINETYGLDIKVRYKEMRDEFIG